MPEPKKIKFITLRGLFERKDDPKNMLTNLTRQLQRDRFDVFEFGEWQAGFNGYDNELERVSSLVASMVEGDLFSEFAFAGYSGGSHILKYAMSKLSTQSKKSVKAVVLCADPSQPSQVDTRLGQDKVYGSMRPGAAGIYEDKSLWMPNRTTYVCDAGDPICFTPKYSPLHSLAITLTTGASGKPLSTASRAKMRMASFGRRYDAAAYGEAIALFNAYAFGGNHQRPYPSLLTQAGRDLNLKLLR